MRHQDPFFPHSVDPRALGQPWAPACPPCNYETAAVIGLVVSVLASAASATVSVISSNNAAKQAELNAEAQNNAIAAEQKRRQLEEQENMRRAVVEQKRFRARQFAQITSSGVMPGTGSALAIEADTWANQQRQIADQNYLNQVEQRQLQYKRTSALAQGQQEAGMYRSQAAGQALSGLASVASSSYQAWSMRPQTIQPAA